MATVQGRPKGFCSPHGSDGFLAAYRLTTGAREQDPGLLGVQDDFFPSQRIILNSGLDVIYNLDRSGLDFAEDLDYLSAFCRAALQGFANLG